MTALPLSGFSDTTDWIVYIYMCVAAWLAQAHTALRSIITVIILIPSHDSNNNNNSNIAL